MPSSPKQMLPTAPNVAPDMKKNLFSSGEAMKGRKIVKITFAKSKLLVIAPTKNSLKP